MTDQDRRRLYEQATLERKNRADRCRQQADADRCILADALLRHAVGTPDYRVERTPQGKPYLPDRPDFHFSLTHSGPWVAIAWGTEPLGLDLEVFRPDARQEKIARRFFCPDEQAYLQRHPDRFFKLWTMKESYLKYRGTGLALALDSFCVLKPEDLGVFFMDHPLENAAMTLCAKTPKAEVRRLTIAEI